MDRFLAIKPKSHDGFNVGYVGTVDWKKMHPEFFTICKELQRKIPAIRFTVVGENKIFQSLGKEQDFISLGRLDIDFIGKVDDVAPYLAEMDVFAYPLRPDHYGTCEIALGEAMAAGVVPVVMDNPAERLICGPGAKDEAEFIRTIEILHELPKFREELSVIVKENAHKRYSVDNMIASWDRVFQEMMLNPKTGKGVLV
jgi:glycosyltransferase involved in cell wall biosynthesis